MGQVIQAGAGQAPARQAALKAGLPNGVGATTINKVCGSGLKAVMLGAASIRAGDADVIVAGGMENMNLGPYLLPGARAGYRLGNAELVDATVHDGLWCAICDVHMGMHAEWMAAKHERHAARRRTSSRCAPISGRWRPSTRAASPTRSSRSTVPGKKGPTDRRHRREPARRHLARGAGPAQARLPAEAGTVTAGNAPGITDGAAALVLASEAAVARDGLQPMARITGYAQADVAPEWLFEAPIDGVQPAAREGWQLQLDDFDLIEINEAFAAQVLADGNALGFDWDRVNVNGGAIALGHPIGASGARVLTTLLHALRRRGGRRGPGHPLPRRRGSGRPGGGDGLRPAEDPIGLRSA